MSIRRKIYPRCIAAFAGVAAFAALAGAQDSVARRLPTVTVTRDVGRSPLDLPYAITGLRPDSLAPGQTHTFVEQTLSFLPGVTVANRTNPAQDTRVSIRGFGARSQFGARSIRIMRDGMPLTLPDGQTPIDYIDLESVGRVEAIRGAASALYGNASGGVLDLKSVEPPTVPFSVQARSYAGGSDLRRFTGLFAGTSGGIGYQGNIGRTTSGGYREFADQRLVNAFFRASTDIGSTNLALIGMGMDMPLAYNPGALSRAQWEANPEQADTSSVQKQARKEVHQVQLGLSARRALKSQGELVGQVYGGTRTLFNPLTFAVVGVDRRQGGGGLRLTVPATTGGVEHRFSVGADAQFMNDARKNWANCNFIKTATASCPVVGPEKGLISLDQRELVSSAGPYVRDELTIGRLRATLGLRADRMRFELQDHFLTDNRDDSGVRTMSAVSPMFGLATRLSPLHSVYANVASAFETPTTTELGNQADGSAGLNHDLKPQYSTTYEVGAKGLLASRVQYDVALFQSEIRDELIAFATPTSNQRMFYRNAGRTRRQGVELALSGDAGPVTLTTTYALSHFRFRDFQTATTQFGGNTIPGIPEHQLQAGATWHIGKAFVVAEALAKSEVFVNDANAASAPCFAVFNLRAGGTGAFGQRRLVPIIALQNVLDKRYVGSVAVNAAGANVGVTKFYEPAPGRTWYVGLSAATNPW
ncbi:MAG TPA: TonB-dependent receptor [Gemmatimonadaceae bacterium]